MGNEQSTSYESSTMSSEKPASYTTRSTTTSNSSSTRKPQPFVGSFFDSHLAPAVPHQQAKKPNRPAGHVNFFEVAAVSPQPTKSIKSSPSNSSSSSLKNGKQSYPSTLNSGRHLSKKSISQVTTTSSGNSSVGSNEIESKLSSISDYIYIHGRKYWKAHGSQKFILPCDDEENERLMTMHYILKSKFGGNFLSPIRQVLSSEMNRSKVLEIGCGAGTWILEMASEFPNTEFVGLDDCPLFPASMKPRNARFKLQNVLKGLPFKDGEFDFIYMRLMMIYFTPEELTKLLREISRVLKPGGYFEVLDTNYTIRNAGPISKKLVNSELKNILQLSTATYESNTNHPIFTCLMLAPQQPSNSPEGHFIDIQQERAVLPLGDWGGGQIEELHVANFKNLLRSIQSTDEALSPLSKHSVDSILDECNYYKSYLDWFSCYARKPFNDDQLEQSTLDSIYEFVDGFVDF
ncbi:hypothetical protein INT47_004512 [Mucor saturninus]|uniref:Methyltransferase domain-containing protein n=1 Tax=Mucor saturninus TaxID=64648 RepID=A0A8H7RIL8_9FUNG|nr:hypothetical protein INT47_004512 [Mucor saturninus]